GPIRGSNRAFGVFGDVMRQEYADTLLEGAMKRGQITPEEIAAFRATGQLPAHAKVLADHANLTTGWTDKPSIASGVPYVGDLVQIAQFAPRFFRSQIELSANALAKWGPQHPEGQLARKSLLKFIGLAAGMTAVINETFGEDIGNYWAPIEDGRVNSNFMRFRVGGRDYSLLGPWDSLLKAVAYTATDRDPSYLARTKASPVLQMTWDLVTGEDFMGKKVRDNPANFATWLVGQFAPFTAGGVPELAQQATTDPLGALGGLAGDIGGVKSSPLSPTEELDQAAQRAYGKGFWSLEADEKDKIKGSYPDLWKRSIEQSGDQRQQAEAVRAEMSALEVQDDQKLLSREITRQQY
ncbi:MAG: hypothetical protein NUV51_09870, partial [Sulfuricaulis sp.]|nr:hypothetical protein [Sulfuricaulis sp.]